jgi:hypothetical protein
MLEHKVDANGVEKLYTPITGEEVRFVDSGDIATA